MKGQSCKQQQGFTLIEMMIVAAIIGLLATIAGGMYTDYIIRVQVAEGIAISAPVRMQMMEFHRENGHWPSNNNMGNLQNQNNISGQFVKMIEVNKHRVEVQYGEDANSVIWGKKLQMEPSVVNGVINWKCSVTGGGVDAKYLPEFCR